MTHAQIYLYKNIYLHVGIKYALDNNLSWFLCLLPLFNDKIIFNKNNCKQLLSIVGVHVLIWLCDTYYL